MAGFGLPNFGQITEAFKKAQQIQQDAQKLQEELDSMELEGSNEDGRVRVWLSGNQQPLRIQIEDSLLKDFFTYRSSSNDDVKELKNDAQELDSRIDELEIELNNMLENIQKEALDTLCYGLDEKYKIINFSRNGARLRDRGRPGSKLVSIKDTLNYDGFKYVLLEVNSLKGYMLLMDINNQKDCYFFKD